MNEINQENFLLGGYTAILRVYSSIFNYVIGQIKDGKSDVKLAADMLEQHSNHVTGDLIAEGNKFTKANTAEYEKVKGEVIQSLANLDDLARMADEKADRLSLN